MAAANEQSTHCDASDRTMSRESCDASEDKDHTLRKGGLCARDFRECPILSRAVAAGDGVGASGKRPFVGRNACELGDQDEGNLGCYRCGANFEQRLCPPLRLPFPGIDFQRTHPGSHKDDAHHGGQTHRVCANSKTVLPLHRPLPRQHRWLVMDVSRKGLVTQKLSEELDDGMHDVDEKEKVSQEEGALHSDAERRGILSGYCCWIVPEVYRLHVEASSVHDDRLDAKYHQASIQAKHGAVPEERQ
mmetsp:Transcript_15004/g.40307  ORF Transcript_15004/g.40307 Transcript_15004/m.40307 type:complete len:247 (-) Transcript_15004:1543-2283(-)